MCVGGGYYKESIKHIQQITFVFLYSNSTELESENKTKMLLINKHTLSNCYGKDTAGDTKMTITIDPYIPGGCSH